MVATYTKEDIYHLLTAPPPLQSIYDSAPGAISGSDALPSTPKPTPPNLIASFNFGVYALEDYSTVLDGTDAIDLEWELGAKLSDISQRTIVQRVYIDIDTNGSG